MEEKIDKLKKNSEDEKLSTEQIKDKRIKELEKENLILKLRINEMEKARLINIVKSKYPEMLENSKKIIGIKNGSPL